MNRAEWLVDVDVIISDFDVVVLSSDTCRVPPLRWCRGRCDSLEETVGSNDGRLEHHGRLDTTFRDAPLELLKGRQFRERADLTVDDPKVEEAHSTA
jgi:hypothetical protein